MDSGSIINLLSETSNLNNEIRDPEISTGTYSIGDGLNYNTVPLFEADIAATLTGDLTGDLAGGVTGDVTGDLTGSVDGNKIKCTSYIQLGAEQYIFFGAETTEASILAAATLLSMAGDAANATLIGSLYVGTDGYLWIFDANTTETKLTRN